MILQFLGTSRITGFECTDFGVVFLGIDMRIVGDIDAFDLEEMYPPFTVFHYKIGIGSVYAVGVVLIANLRAGQIVFTPQVALSLQQVGFGQYGTILLGGILQHARPFALGITIEGKGMVVRPLAPHPTADIVSVATIEVVGLHGERGGFVRDGHTLVIVADILVVLLLSSPKFSANSSHFRTLSVY